MSKRESNRKNRRSETVFLDEKIVIFIFLLLICSSFFGQLAVNGSLFAVEKNLSDIQQKQELPNIIFIMADDLGYGDLSCYGQKKFQTPNIDRLAAEGMKFTQMYAGTTVCAPSRCSLMTGLHTGHTYIRGNGGGKPFGENPIPDETITLAEVLKSKGYATGLFGKWGLGAVGNEGDPNKQGFDEFFGYYSQMEAHNYFPPRLHRNGEEIKLDGKTYSHALIMNEALKFIRNNKNRPFFCYLPVTIPHAAMQVPEENMTPWRAKFPEFENVIGKYSYNTEVRNPVAAFPAMLTNLDNSVGEILALLKELKIDEKTLVVFTSDNGPHHEGGHRSDFFDSNGPFTGYKRDLTDGGIREPFLIRWPSKIASGIVSDHVCAFWDILPTFAELSNVDLKAFDFPTPQPTENCLDGISLVPTFFSQPQDQKKHDYLYWEFHEEGGKRAVRFEQWKAVQNNVNKTPNGQILLFDVVADPEEKNDRAADFPELVEKARSLFLKASSDNPKWKFKK